MTLVRVRDTSDRIDGEVIFKPGTDGFDITTQSNTLDIYANGDVELDASLTSNKVDINTTNSQRIFSDDVIINAGGSSRTGFIVSSSTGTQTFNTSGDLNMQAGTQVRSSPLRVIRILQFEDT